MISGRGSWKLCLLLNRVLLAVVDLQPQKCFILPGMACASLQSAVDGVWTYEEEMLMWSKWQLKSFLWFAIKKCFIWDIFRFSFSRWCCLTINPAVKDSARWSIGLPSLWASCTQTVTNADEQVHAKAHSGLGWSNICLIKATHCKRSAIIELSPRGTADASLIWTFC